jgi:cation diffusion facilitator family transporter
MRGTQARTAALVSIGVNLVLAALTALFAIRVGSIAMLAQAAHTASDVLTSVVVLVGFRVAAAPADREHPWGHGRAESIATITIAMLLAVVGLEFVREGASSLINPGHVIGSWVVAGFMIGVALAKEGLARYALTVGRRIESKTVEADAWHHRADALAATMAAAAVGGAALGITWLDGLLALGIAGIILHTAYKLGREAASSLLGREPDPTLVQRIMALAMAVDGVEEAHRISVHEYGNLRIVSLHVLVDPRLGLGDAHRIAELVEYAIDGHLASETTVHIEPNLPTQSLEADRRYHPDH